MKSEIRRRRIISALVPGFGSGGGGNTPAQIADAFRTRVLADSGTFEAQSCLESQITALGSFYNQASFILTANGYKYGNPSGKLFALKPTDGSGDLAFTRSTPGYRKNESYLQEMSINTPRLDYLGFNCPTLLLEPARTNLALRSEEFTSASWVNLNTTDGKVSSSVNNNPELYGFDNIFRRGNDLFGTSNLGNCLVWFDVTDRNNPILLHKVYGNGTTIKLNGVIGVCGDDDENGYVFTTAIGDNAVQVFLPDRVNGLVPISNIVHGGGGGDGAALTSPWIIRCRGSLLFVGVNHGLEILDRSDESNLTHVGKILHNAGLGIYLEVVLDVQITDDGLWAVCAAFNSGAITTISIVDPANPTHGSSLLNGVGGSTTLGMHSIRIVGTKILGAARNSDAIEVADAANMNAISHFSNIVSGGGGGSGAPLNGVVDFDISGNKLIASIYEGAGATLLDITDLSAITFDSSVSIGTYPANAGDMVLWDENGTHFWLTDYEGAGLFYFDATNTASITLVSRVIANNARILETVTNGLHIISQSFTKAASSLSYTGKMIVKGGLGRDSLCLQIGDGATAAVGRFFNITTGTLGGTRTVGSGYTLVESKITTLGNDVYECDITVTSNTATTLNLAVLTSTDGTTVSYAGDITKGFYITKMNIKPASSPITDSYIFAQDSSVARGADLITRKTGATALIGQAEGSVFIDFARAFADGVSECWAQSDGTLNNRIVIEKTTGNAWRLLIVAGGVTQVDISSSAFVNLSRQKVMAWWSASSSGLVVNGSEIGTDASATIPALDTYGWDSGAGAAPLFGNLYELSFAKTAVTSAYAQTLTTI